MHLTYLSLIAVLLVSFFFNPANAKSLDKIKAEYTGFKQCHKKYPGSFENGLSNKCYACPKGYKHAWWRSIKSKKVCYKRKPTRHAVAKYKGREGCKAGSFEYLPTGKCYTCPKGYKRNLNVLGDPAKSKVCSFDKKGLQKKYKATREKGLKDLNLVRGIAQSSSKVPTAAALKAKFRTNEEATPPVGPFGVTQYAADRKRIDYMERVLNSFPAHNEKYGTDYQTVSYVKTSGLAVIGGYAKEWGFSMTSKSNGTIECRKFESNVYSAGVQVDFDVAEGVGIHQYPISDIDGKSNGYTSSVTWFDSLFAWTTSGQPSIGLYWPSITHNDGAMVADGGVITSFGISAAYAHSSTTQSQTPVPCDVLVWGPDFDRVSPYSWVEESK